MSLINVLSSGLLLLEVAQGARVSGTHCFLWPILCLHFKLNIPALPYKFPLTCTEALMTCTEFAHSLIYSWLPAPVWKEGNGSNVVLASFLSHPLILASVSLYSVSKHINDFRQCDWVSPTKNVILKSSVHAQQRQAVLLFVWGFLTEEILTNKNQDAWCPYQNVQGPG